MAQRPRTSILSLFDPLSLSPTSDKENNAGETSFFHPPGFPKPSPVAHHTLRRRLIDVGDMTVDEPSMRDLLEMEDELEELNKHITEDDDGDTLTWRDMAKAATPKWSGRHATSFTTPKSSPTPRTPLAEISFKDEMTPMARKKSYKRQIISGPSKIAQVGVTPERSHPASSSPPVDMSSDESSEPPTSPPSIQISSVDLDVKGKDDSHNALGSSICTLNLSTSTNILLADTSLPLSISQSSSQSSSKSSPSPNTHLTPPHPQPRLRPESQTKASTDKRLSVDLQSSFQLHLSASDASFDLLNEKISFFNLNNGTESFLNNLEIDDSFGDDDFVVVKPDVEDAHLTNPPECTDPKPTPVEATNPIPQSSTQSSRPESLRVFVPKLKPTAEISGESEAQPIAKPLFNDNIHESHVSPSATIHGPPSAKLPSPTRSSIDEKELNMLSTPCSSYTHQNPPKPVPALKIVKRSKLLAKRPSTATHNISTTASTSNSTTSASRRTSSISINPPAARATIATSVSSSPAINPGRNGHGPQLMAAHRTKRTAAPSFSNPPLSGDGPRRVLASEGPKLNSHSNSRIIGHPEPSKAPSTVIGPRRIVANPIVEKSVGVVKPVAASQVSCGLKQPVKYNTIGASSGIPKPVSRTAGSRLPAPASGTSKSRFGVPTVAASAPGNRLPIRRVT